MQPPRERAFSLRESIPIGGAMLYDPQALRGVPKHDPPPASGVDSLHAASEPQRADR